MDNCATTPVPTNQELNDIVGCTGSNRFWGTRPAEILRSSPVNDVFEADKVCDEGKR